MRDPLVGGIRSACGDGGAVRIAAGSRRARHPVPDPSRDPSWRPCCAPPRSSRSPLRSPRRPTPHAPRATGGTKVPTPDVLLADLDTWTEPTPLGGVWDSELDSFGVWSALGVHFNGIGATPSTAEMAEVDDAIDDGDVTAGAFRQLASDRYDFVIQEVETVYGAP